MIETKKKSNVGRKDKYHSHVEPRLEEIKAWCRDGATTAIICAKLGVGYSNFHKYKKDHKELEEVLRENKDIIDMQVENALLKNALGFEYDEVKTIVEDVNGKKVARKEITKKFMPGDSKAQMFWLKNRKPGMWKNDYRVNMGGKVEVNNTGEVNHNHTGTIKHEPVNIFETMTKEELLMLAQMELEFEEETEEGANEE